MNNIFVKLKNSIPITNKNNSLNLISTNTKVNFKGNLPCDIIEIQSKSHSTKKPFINSFAPVFKGFQPLVLLSQEMNYKGQFYTILCMEQIKNFIPENLWGQISVRVKSVDAIKSKLFRKNGSNIDDIVGYRVSLNTKEIDNMVDNLAVKIQKGSVKLKQIQNYSHNKESSYLNEKQINKLRNACKKAGYELNVIEKEKDSGYIGSHFTININNNFNYELQLRGDLINHIAQTEHAFYDFKKGKQLPPECNYLKSCLSSMNETGLTQYGNYIKEIYKYARNKELGINSPIPKLPENLNPILEIKLV